jgi:hypothetical protein
MEVSQQTETTPPTPEQLLKLLDLQLAHERGKRAHKSRNRATFLVVGILFIIVAAGIALVVAQGLLSELHDRGALQPISGQMDDLK